MSGGFYFVGNNLCLDFVNTEVVEGSDRKDLLEGFEGLVIWSVEVGTIDAAQGKEMMQGWSNKPDADAVIARAREFRDSLRHMAERISQGKLSPQPTIDSINNLLSKQTTHAQVVRVRGGYERRLRIDFAEPLHLLVPIAGAAVELLCDGDLSLVKRCENPACILYFYDTTKNHARRWCSMSGCGNRAKVAAHYQRKRVIGAAEQPT